MEDPSYKSMISQIADDKNLIVIRTFSKIYGMAGARIGYIFPILRSSAILASLLPASAATELVFLVQKLP
ncbi:MAG: aminotransferase class I/II-fold pyridoxal phosphate-dependent enzyme [Lachnospiraceae bacterium]